MASHPAFVATLCLTWCHGRISELPVSQHAALLVPVITKVGDPPLYWKSHCHRAALSFLYKGQFLLLRGLNCPFVLYPLFNPFTVLSTFTAHIHHAFLNTPHPGRWPRCCRSRN